MSSFWCKPTTDTRTPDPTSERYSDLAWRLRYAPESITDADKMLCASVFDAYSTYATHVVGDDLLANLRGYLA